MKGVFTMMIIPSGKPKIWDKEPEIGAVESQFAYTGTFHRLAKAYALEFDPHYLIVSPYYGFLRPTTVIPHTYDTRFTLKGITAETIQLESLQKQWRELAVSETTITVLGGKKFQPLLSQILPSGTTLLFPLDSLGGIGVMQQHLKIAVAKKKPLPSRKIIII